MRLVSERELAAVRGSLKFALEIEGFAVRTYPKGADLLDDLRRADCACFIIDQKLPGMNGLEVVAELRKEHIAAPVILIEPYSDRWPERWPTGCADAGS